MVSPVLLAALLGVATGAGAFAILYALWPARARLSDAIDQLDGRTPGRIAIAVDPGTSRIEKLGVWGYQRLRLPLTEQTTRQLAVQGRSISDFFAEKAIWTIAGFAAPLLFSLVNVAMGGALTAWPIAFSLIGALAGFFVPDARLRAAANSSNQAAVEGLFMFFDLVTLERLANRSVTQALQSVSAISNEPVFVRIHTALDRARLEQVAPWRELHRAADELGLPELADMADVLQLDEQGASLAEPLRNRVRELRDANLTKLKMEAQEQTERMTIWMTLPTLIFGLIFLVPPLLRISGGWG